MDLHVVGIIKMPHIDVDVCSHIKLLHTELSPVPTETRPRTSSTPLGQNSATPHKMTPKRFLEYEKMREEAAIGELVLRHVLQLNEPCFSTYSV